MLSKSLTEAGLSAHEAAAYLAMLELGPGSVSAIAAKAGIQRPQMYGILNGLQEKGLVLRSMKGKRMVYAAEQPERLQEILKEKLSLVDSVLPQLAALAEQHVGQPTMSYVEGLAGIKKAYLGSARAKEKQLFAIVGVENLTKRSLALEKFWNGPFKDRRLQHNVKGTVIVPDNKAGKSFQARDEQNFRESRRVPASTYNFPAEILAYDNTVVFISYNRNEEFALTLESEAIAATMKMIWKIIWNAGY